MKVFITSRNKQLQYDTYNVDQDGLYKNGYFQHKWQNSSVQEKTGDKTEIS